jgi:hypothetical protein
MASELHGEVTGEPIVLEVAVQPVGLEIRFITLAEISLVRRQ